MRLRCQCVLILCPGPNGDAPHQCSLFGVDFDHFKSQSVKYWCTQTRAAFRFIANAEGSSAKVQISQDLSGLPDPLVTSRGCYVLKPDVGQCKPGAGGCHKGGQRVSPHGSGCADRNKPNGRRIATAVNKRVAVHQGERSRRRAAAEHRAGTTPRSARQRALPVGAVSTVAC